MSEIAVSAFYKFVDLPQFAELRAPLLTLCRDHGIRGTILLAPEGINGTIAGVPENLAAAIAGIRAFDAFQNLESKRSFAHTMPFRRMKVRLKREIVTLGVSGVDPKLRTGRYVAPRDWNALLAEPEVLVIDTRNAFEVATGSFEGAINPQTRSFGDFPDFVRTRLAAAKHRKIAMFCTGGIRCEKATSFLLSQGFSQVYQLRGGILKYLEEIPSDQSLWRGQCFVFDERVGLTHRLEVTQTREVQPLGTTENGRSRDRSTLSQAKPSND